MFRWRRLKDVVLLTLFFYLEADGLDCVCTDCGGIQESICTVPDGGACYAQLVLFQGIEMRRQRCYQPYSTYLCNTSTNTAVIQCCSADLCNEHLHPEWGDGTSSSSSNQETTTGPASSTDIISPFQPFSLYCYEYDSKTDTSATYCYTTVGCYRTERRERDSKIPSRFKQGCSESCVEEDRNRVTNICCNTTLCNAFEWQTPPPLIPISQPDTSGSDMLSGDTASSEEVSSGDGESGQNPNEVLQNYTSTEILASPTSSIPPTHVTSTLHQVMNMMSSITPTRTQSSTPQPTHLSSTTTHLPSTQVPTNIFGTFISTYFKYLVVSLVLTIMCVAVLIILVILIIYICYKNQQLLRTRAQYKNQYKKQYKRKQSMDTLSSSNSSMTV